MAAEDETQITEISIGPDGRIFVFGLSESVLEVVAELSSDLSPARRRLAALRPAQSLSAPTQLNATTSELQPAEISNE
jgi:hypothetical protein